MDIINKKKMYYATALNCDLNLATTYYNLIINGSTEYRHLALIEERMYDIGKDGAYDSKIQQSYYNAVREMFIQAKKVYSENVKKLEKTNKKERRKGE